MKTNKWIEKNIIDMHRAGWTYGEIGRWAGISRQRAHQIVKYKKRYVVQFKVWKYEITIYEA